MRKIRLIVLFVLVFSFSTFAQNAKVESFKLNSKLMNREMPYRVLLPSNYDKQKDSRFPVIYLLHGLWGHFNNWTDKSKLAEYANYHQYIIINPEGNDGWYTDSISTPNDRFESYIIQELIPEIDRNFRTLAERKNRNIAGLSMGGYGALKFGLKFPEMFSVAGSFSGALGAASTIVDEKNKSLAGSIMNVFGDAASQTRKENDIFLMLKAMPPEKIKQLPFIYLDCGTEDFLIQNNRDFVNLLVEKKVSFEFRQLPGGHTWDFWDSQVQEFLRLSDKRLALK